MYGPLVTSSIWSCDRVLKLVLKVVNQNERWYYLVLSEAALTISYQKCIYELITQRDRHITHFDIENHLLYFPPSLVFSLPLSIILVKIMSMVSCQKGPTRHAYAWQIGPFWQDTLDVCWLGKMVWWQIYGSCGDRRYRMSYGYAHCLPVLQYRWHWPIIILPGTLCPIKRGLLRFVCCDCIVILGLWHQK